MWLFSVSVRNVLRSYKGLFLKALEPTVNNSSFTLTTMQDRHIAAVGVLTGCHKYLLITAYNINVHNWKRMDTHIAMYEHSKTESNLAETSILNVTEKYM